MGLDNLDLNMSSPAGGLDGIGKNDRTKTITYRVSPDQHRKLKTLAASNGITLTELIDSALAAYNAE